MNLRIGRHVASLEETLARELCADSGIDPDGIDEFWAQFQNRSKRKNWEDVRFTAPAHAAIKHYDKVTRLMNGQSKPQP